MNSGSVESVLAVEAESPRELIQNKSDVFVTLEPASSIALGETTETATEPSNG